ncbi:MAG: hypothetical protein Q4A54_10260 [Parabacteroides sp.]|nr:hypothetical protein [Parabacteroides sp.]
MYPFFATTRYDWVNVKWKPYMEARVGAVYDPYWISKVQAYGALGFGVEVYKNISLGCRGILFSRPSRYFSANVSLVFAYRF